ncbi:hypothetical protein AAMO2058_000446000 [Amorphochlora amoebiformis]
MLAVVTVLGAILAPHGEAAKDMRPIFLPEEGTDPHGGIPKAEFRFPSSHGHKRRRRGSVRNGRKDRRYPRHVIGNVLHKTLEKHQLEPFATMPPISLDTSQGLLSLFEATHGNQTNTTHHRSASHTLSQTPHLHPPPPNYIFVLYHTHSHIMQEIWNQASFDDIASAPSNSHFIFGSYGDRYLNLEGSAPRRSSHHRKTFDGKVQELEERLVGQIMSNPHINTQEKLNWVSRLHFLKRNPLDNKHSNLYKSLLSARYWSTLVFGLQFYGNKPHSHHHRKKHHSRSLIETSDQETYLGGHIVEALPLFSCYQRPIEPILSIFSGQYPLAYFGHACHDKYESAETHQDVRGKIALISRGGCSFAEKIAKATVEGAKGVLMFSYQGLPPISTIFDANEGDKAGNHSDSHHQKTSTCAIPALMISSRRGWDVRKLLLRDSKSVYPSARTRARGIEMFGVDCQQRFRTLGTFEEASLTSAVLEMKYFNYQYKLNQELTRIRSSGLVINAIKPSDLQLTTQIKTTLTLPKNVDGFSALGVELKLTCPDGIRSRCGEYDHLLSLTASHITQGDKKGEGFEIARFVSPFSGPGHWLADASPWLPMFSNGAQFQFTLSCVALIQHVVQVNLHFYDGGIFTPPDSFDSSLMVSDKRFLSGSPSYGIQADQALAIGFRNAGDSPIGVWSLFEGGRFDKTYNMEEKHARTGSLCLRITNLGGSFIDEFDSHETDSCLPVRLSTHPTPSLYTTVENSDRRISRLVVHALVTGHGWGVDVDNCAEFCETEHEITTSVLFNGRRITEPLLGSFRRKLEFLWAGTEYGCEERVVAGVTPNQAGTWSVGRAGWCPGGVVQPTIFAEIDLRSLANHLVTHRVPNESYPTSQYHLNHTLPSWPNYLNSSGSRVSTLRFDFRYRATREGEVVGGRD